MVATDVGSLDWGESTGGRLDRWQQWALVVKSLPELAVLGRSRLLLALGRRGDLVADATAMIGPMTAVVRSVKASAELAYRDTILRDHAYRTAAFSSAIADDVGLWVDPELLWCACLLHDLELDAPVQGRCFAVRSAQRAKVIMLDAGAPRRSAEDVADAISRHPTPGLDPRRHPLAYLVATGALVDVVGSRLERFDRQSVDGVLAIRPRDDFADTLVRLWRAEGKAVPGGRARLTGRLGLTLATRHSPWPRPAG